MNVNELNDWNRANRRARPFIFANVLFFKDKSKKLNSMQSRESTFCAPTMPFFDILVFSQIISVYWGKGRFSKMCSFWAQKPY